MICGLLLISRSTSQGQLNPDALTHDDQPVWAGQFTEQGWESLEAQSQTNPFAFKMPCCQSRAVLKTSSNGLPFFSHLSDECTTAPETVWHIEGKDLVFGALKIEGPPDHVPMLPRRPEGVRTVPPDRHQVDQLRVSNYRCGCQSCSVGLDCK